MTPQLCAALPRASIATRSSPTAYAWRARARYSAELRNHLMSLESGRAPDTVDATGAVAGCGIIVADREQAAEASTMESARLSGDMTTAPGKAVERRLIADLETRRHACTGLPPLS